MSKRFVRDTAIGNAFGVPAIKDPPVSRWKKLWEFTGGAMIEGLKGDVAKDETDVFQSPQEVSLKFQPVNVQTKIDENPRMTRTHSIANKTWKLVSLTIIHRSLHQEPSFT
jgi:hypothetical protein